MQKAEGKHPSRFSNQDLCDNFKLIFNTGFILCCCPFRITKQCTSNYNINYQTKYNWFQIFLCTVPSVLFVTFTLCDTHLALKELALSKGNPAICFLLAAQGIKLILYFVVIRQLLSRPNSFVTFFNLITDNRNLPHVRKTTVSKIKIITSITLILRLVLGNRVVQDILALGFSFPFSLEYWARFAAVGETCIKLKTPGDVFWKNTSNNGSIIADVLSPAEHFYASISLLISFLRAIYVTYAEIILTITNSIIWAFAFEFSTHLKTLETPESKENFIHCQLGSLTKPWYFHNHSKFRDWERIILEYYEIRKLCIFINDKFGTIVSLYLTYVTLYYAVLFDSVGTWASFISQVVYLLGTATCLVFAADFSFQVNRLKDWLTLHPNAHSLSGSELQMLVNQLDNNDVAIKASQVFPITYSLLAKVVGLTITYLIICMQST